MLDLLQVIILDVRVPCTPVARLSNHRACVNGIAWAPHSSCHICTAGKSAWRRTDILIKLGIYEFMLVLKQMEIGVFLRRSLMTKT